MMKILANDGIDAMGKKILEDAGYQVVDQHLSPDELLVHLCEYDALTVRSATQVHRRLIDAAPKLKLIGRGGVGMDNIDVAYARAKGIQVFNTPAASSQSVAELVFAHLFSGARFLYYTQREMPAKGQTDFSGLKKACAGGMELRGKTLGIVGYGRIGQEVARMGLSLGMHILVCDHRKVENTIDLTFSNGSKVELPIQQIAWNDLCREADFITFHVPFVDRPLLGREEFPFLKPGVGLINTARGGVIDEQELIAALDRGQVAFAGLDVFSDEPVPSQELLAHPRVSLSPHIGAATGEAQQRVSQELASRIVECLQRFVAASAVSAIQMSDNS